MEKTRTVGQKWLANELDFQFLIIREFTKFQSNRLILSKVIEYTDRQADRLHPKNHFFSLRGGNLMKNGGFKFCINLIPSLMKM